MHRKVSNEIIESLRRDISTGKLAAGSRLPNERDLAQQYGVSQPTIREVVRALDVMGLVEVRHGSGAWVRGDAGFLLRSSLETMLQIENVSILQVLDVRGLLGRDSARRAAIVSTPDDVDAIQDAYARLDATEEFADLDELIAAISAFQVALAQAAHNTLQSSLEHFLIDLLLHLQFKVMRKRGLRFWQERAAAFQPDRAAILSAVVARDPDLAAETMAAYLQHQRETFVADRELAELRLSDPRAVAIAGDLRQSGRLGSSPRWAPRRSGADHAAV